MSPHGESFVPREFREPREERPIAADPAASGRETHSNLVSLTAERKRRREADAHASVDVAIRAAGGNLEVVRQHVEQRLRQAREKIDKLENFDRAAQEESEFLKAQRDAINGRIAAERQAAPTRPIEAPRPATNVATPEQKPQGLLDRMRSGWSDLKARLFGGGESSIPDYKGTITAYEETWDDERLAARGPAREAELARLQANTVENLRKRERAAAERLDIVRNILAQRGIVTRQKREQLPETVRARYAREQAQLEASLKDIRGQLRIAEATRRRNEDERIRA